MRRKFIVGNWKIGTLLIEADRAIAGHIHAGTGEQVAKKSGLSVRADANENRRRRHQPFLTEGN